MCGCFQPSSSPIKLVNLGQFRVIKQSKLAEGAYGDVWKCKSQQSDTIYALKEIRLQNKELREMFDKQSRILSKLREKSVKRSVKLLKSTIQNRKQEGSIGCMLFEFGTISLFDEISSHKFTNSQFLKIMYEIASSLEQIHSLGICHLDIKPQNLILIEGQYKLCDFGSALQKEIVCNSLSKKDKNIMQEYIESNSTLIYRSPEMIELNQKSIGYPSDVWMLGCIAYFIYFRKHPFEGEGKLAIISPNVPYPEHSPITKFIQSLLTLDPAGRPTASQVKQQIEHLQSQI